MRIIGGSGKGRVLKSPLVKKIRLTSDKVKEALFNILGKRIVGAYFLELFAGSGSVGVESLSRGAKAVVFVDNDNRCIKTIRENLKLFNLKTSREVATLLQLDAFKAISLLHRQRKKFNIIFLDPPYYRGWVKKSLINLSHYDILKRNGIIIAEHSKKDIPFQNIGRLRLVQQRRYSDTFLSFYKRS
jgi:16S rRNA (guanine(966)-N(2))-methyltransferase RsmD